MKLEVWAVNRQVAVNFVGRDMVEALTVFAYRFEDSEGPDEV
jgi:hypothetical protein